MSRYREGYRGAVIYVVTERIDAAGIEPTRRVKAVLVTRNGVNLGYRPPPYAGPDDQALVSRAFDEARDFINRT